MEIGIFAKTFQRSTLEETLEAVAQHGFRHIQFNMACAGLEPMPAEIDPALVTRIRQACDARGLTIAALSGTFNMAHPDRDVQDEGLRRLGLLIPVADELGAGMISLCSGTRDPDNMWRWHPNNESRMAWTEAIDSISYAMALDYEIGSGMRFGIEPEPGNIVSNARKAREMLHEIGSNQYGIILDPANIIDGVPEDQVDAAIGASLAEIGHRIISVHGKDRDACGNVVPAGQGIVPWESFIAGLERVGYGGTILLHGLEEADVPQATQFLRASISSG